MKKLFTLLCLCSMLSARGASTSVYSEDSEAHGDWFFRSLSGGGQGLSIAPNTNLAVTNIIAPLKFTNVNFVGYGSVYSNSIAFADVSEPIPAFQPYSGTFYGLTVSNSLLIANTQHVAAFGLSNAVMPSTSMSFYDLTAIGSGTNGDAVSWKQSISGTIPTNDISFFNSKFLASHYAFNQVGRGTFHFYGSLFSAIGPGSGGETVAFLPDQGPLTNWLYGCHLIARNGGSVTIAFLEQINSYNYFNGCTIEATETNASAGNVAGVACSGEGSYVSDFNSCFFRTVGGASPYIIDLSNGGASSVLILKNCYWEGLAGPVVVNNTGGETITVTGGNFKPSNFASLTGVTFLNPGQSFGGNSGTAKVPASTTVFYAPSGNSVTNLQTSDTSSMTRIPVQRQVDLVNLRVTRDAAGGIGHTSTVTIMTNGVASSIVASLNNAATGSDTTHTVRIAAGTEIGIKIVAPASDTPGAFAWSFEGQ